MWHVLLSYRYRPGTYQCFVSAEKKHPYCASVVYFLFSFKHRSHSNKPRSNKSLTHQVPKLDGGEPGLDDWPQAPKEVGCQGEPITQSLCYMPFFFFIPFYCIILYCVMSCQFTPRPTSELTCWPPRTAPPSLSFGPLHSGCQTLDWTRADSSQWSGAAQGDNKSAQRHTRAQPKREDISV